MATVKELQKKHAQDLHSRLNVQHEQVTKELRELRSIMEGLQAHLERRAGGAEEEKDDGKCYMGVNGVTGEIVDMNDLGIWEPYSVKVQTIKTAIENACMILRIDDVVSGSKKSK